MQYIHDLLKWFHIGGRMTAKLANYMVKRKQFLWSSGIQFRRIGRSKLVSLMRGMYNNPCIIIHIYICIYCIFVSIHTRDSMDELLQLLISPEKWSLFQLEEKRFLFLQGLPSLPMGAMQFNQRGIDVQSFRFTHFLQFLTHSFPFSILTITVFCYWSS